MAHSEKSSLSHPYRGIHTSLYKSISNETIQCIERSIWLRTTGRIDAAREILEKELDTHHNTPIIVIERANVEHEAGRWGQAWRILNIALQDLKDAEADLDIPEHRLMTLMWVMFGVRHRGDLSSAVQELERARQWLCHVRVAEYTDIQTSCVRFYALTYLFTRMSSDFHDPAIENVPVSNTITSAEQKEPWKGLHDLRRSLVERRLFNEANAVFRVELNRTPLAEREPVVEEFLAQILTLPSILGRDLIESYVRLQWSTAYAQVQNAARALEELTASEAAFNRWCEEFSITETWTVPQFQAIVCAKLDFIGVEVVKLQMAEQFANIFAKYGSSKTGIVLSTATESALALFHATAENEYLEKYFALHKRLEQYDEDVSEDLCDLIVHRNPLISLTSTNLVDRQKSLEWIDGFFERYPFFALPGEMESLHRRRSTLLRGLQRHEESKEAEELANSLKDKGPSLGKWTHMNFGTFVNSEPNSSGSSKIYDPDEDEDGITFFQPWTAIAGDPEKVVHTACALLCQWAPEDVRTGHLTVQKYRIMMQETYQDAEDGKELHPGQTDDRIDSYKQQAIMTVLVPPDKIAAEGHRGRWDLIVDWLSDPPKGQRLKRLFCLLMLRDARQYHFADLSAWDHRNSELEQLLQFHSTLPRKILEITCSQSIGWLAGLASTYIAQLGGTPDLSDPSIYTLVLQAEKYSNMAIDALRRDHQPAQLMIQQRVGAQICLLKITRLEQRLTGTCGSATPSHQHDKPEFGSTSDVSNPRKHIQDEITAIRTVGIEKIKESEQISTASELEASWLDGLDGVKERQRLLEFQSSFWTVQNAIHLLLKQCEPTEEATTAIWNWVQKYKARSLARTIGTRSDLPPGLLSQILSSTDARSVYEDMLNLQKAIDTAPLRARFDLRRRMDRIRCRMKQDPLLRRLIDLREGSPLEREDIKGIEEQAGRPVVLVDWFYLPPYPDNASNGRMLLLTATSRCTPTLDILDTSMEDIDAWQTEFLNPRKLCHLETRHAFNKRLGGLVAPLLHRSKAGEILVFCPSATLHRLPLHALNVTTRDPRTADEHVQPIAHRNPIVYIHSLSLLRSSFSAAEHARHSPQAVNPRFMAGISEADATAVVNGRQVDYTAGRTSINKLAQICDTSPMIDDTATKEEFEKAVMKSRLLHIQTHCNWTFADPLDHHVEFPTPSGAKRIASSQDLKLTAKEVFEMRLCPGTHVSMIACQGGLVEVKIGDEVMGLVPALLYSGATSTVSTLWSIADTAGARFSELFFEALFDQCQTQSEDARETAIDNPQVPTTRTGFVDVALAVQNALVEMDPYGIEPLYNWAGFVLHGYWIFSVPWEDSLRFGNADL